MQCYTAGFCSCKDILMEVATAHQQRFPVLLLYITAQHFVPRAWKEYFALTLHTLHQCEQGLEAAWLREE